MLTILGVLHVIAGAVTYALVDLSRAPACASADCGASSTGAGRLIVSLPLMGSGVILTAVGIPLWVTGAIHVPTPSAKAGATAVVGWTFAL